MVHQSQLGWGPVILRSWALLRPHILHPVRRALALSATSAVAGFLEASVLVIVVNVASAVSKGTSETAVNMPIVGISFGTGALLWIAGGAAVGLFALHMLVARLQASLSANVLASVRRRVVTAFLQASWPVQSLDREGALQETVGTIAVQSSLVSLWFATAAAALLNLITLLLTATLVDPYAMLIVVGLGLALFVAMRPVSRLTSRKASLFVEANSVFSEDVAGVSTMAMEFRTFGVQDRLQERLIEQNQAVALEQRRTRFASSFGVFLYRDLAVLCIVGGVAALSVAGDQLTQIAAVLLLVVRGLAHATLLQGTIQAIHEHSPNLVALDARLERLEGAADVYGNARPTELGDIELVDVSYEYEPGQAAIHGVTLKLAKGETVGIVGPSGSGKSTLLQVLLRLRRPTGGNVYAAGVPYADIEAPTWAKLVAFVPQEPKLIEATVEDNLRFLRPDISRAQTEQAADAAHVGDEIRRLPAGFDTKLGPRGSGLSGGQKQRVAIARALLGNPKLLVLDEPTSALDSLSEERLQETIAQLKGHITMVIVAHRLSTLDVCDRLIVLRNGTVDSVARPEAVRLSGLDTIDEPLDGEQDRVK